MAHPELYTEQFMAKNIVQPLLLAIEFMHDQNIVHRYRLDAPLHSDLLHPKFLEARLITMMYFQLHTD